MGKRKSSKPPPKKVRPKLDVSFNCPFCNSNKSVTATMDWDGEVRSPSSLHIILCGTAQQRA
jgi:transcription elongation factor Elf1